MSDGFTLYPAIDVRAGRVVRLAQGDYARETHYGDDPLAVALGYAEQGAQWLHLVDLDAARAGGYTLLPLLRTLASDGRLRVQTGGGVRGRDDVVRLLEAGASRVVVGSLAVREPDSVGLDRSLRCGPITVALDARLDTAGIWRLPVHGWTETGEESLAALAVRYADGGLRHLLSTDIARDGMLTGPNLALYDHLRSTAPALSLQASGGVSGVADVTRARDAGCAGIVLGRALLERRFSLREALQAATCWPGIIPCLDVRDGRVVRASLPRHVAWANRHADRALRDEGATNWCSTTSREPARGSRSTTAGWSRCRQCSTFPSCVAGASATWPRRRAVLNAGADKISITRRRWNGLRS